MTHIINNPRIIHICRDDICVDSGITMLEQALGFTQDLYVILDTKDPEIPKRVLEHTHQVVRIACRLDVIKFVQNLPQADLYVFHGLEPLLAAILHRMPKSSQVLWLYMGYEVYKKSLFFIKQNCTPRTLQLLGQNSSWIYKERLRWWKHSIMGYMNAQSFVRAPITPRDYFKTLQRPQWFGSPLSKDFDYIRQIVQIKAKLFSFSYYGIEHTIGSALLESKIQGDSIWLGNSATPENNHADIIDLLAKSDLQNRKIICPLSYGNLKYAQLIHDYGTTKLGSNWNSLLNFMPRMEYNQILITASVMIMNHQRQQAFGSIVTGLWLGAKVFLNEKNTIFKELRSMGVHVYSVQADLLTNPSQAFSPLSAEQIAQNRLILTEKLSMAAVLSHIRHSASQIFQSIG